MVGRLSDERADPDPVDLIQKWQTQPSSVNHSDSVRISTLYYTHTHTHGNMASYVASEALAQQQSADTAKVPQGRWADKYRGVCMSLQWELKA